MHDVLILAGGGARRLGGLDKPGLLVGGTSLLDRVLQATAGAATTVVVGPVRDTVRPVVWTREDPPGGGPVAALAAGLEHVTSDTVVLLAADLPFLRASMVDVLTGGLPPAEHGAVFVDGRRPQWLCSSWRTGSLRAALQGVVVDGARLQDVLGRLRALWITEHVDGAPPGWTDVDTEDDLRRARASA